MSSVEEAAGATSSGTSDEAMMLPDLSFPALSAAMARYSQVTEQSRAGPVERWSFAIGLMGAAVGMLFGTLLEGKAAFYWAAAGLAVELIGFLVSAVLLVKRELPGFRRPHADHASQMEQEFHQYHAIVAALRTFPFEQRRRREAFMRDRRTNMHERLGLFTGGMEKLGIMPVLLALYLQLKDWRWGDWTVLSKITLMQGVFAFLLLFAYGMSWHLIRLRVRVQSYEQLLAEANRQDSANLK
ncbi:hypothetical protein LMG31884_24290 [Xanthomonas hydrangeae]|nr:hypothetical protein LMG31884_24290 [Xanthomonas hydrangeae]CAD7716965.1 hypothetical protein LMG31884_24290 [Xanthomonas hydrangeae]CAD7733169.1 hypothetical protein LMG31887_24170 [Xanthomonas hydrangeae]CAD7733172.1 hypothetical protein LMG31887_24170 [Xanthomonas hydrangeae]